MRLGVTAAADVAGLGELAVRIDLGDSRGLTYKGLSFQCETPDGTQWFIARQPDGSGRDAQGQLVSSGLYFYRLVTPSHPLVQKMMFVKQSQ